MSSADSGSPPSAPSGSPAGAGWPPPLEVKHRPHRVAYVLAVLLPLALLVALALPVGIVWGISRLVTSSSVPDPPSRGENESPGAAGAGDPYFPDYGASGYDALSYRISLDWDPAGASMTASTVITARASQELTSFSYDLAVPTRSVTVNGQPAAFSTQGFADVQVTPAAPIRAGATFEVSVSYAGVPGRIRRGRTTPWLSTGQEWTAAGEPESSAWWYPANDHPSDPALMDVSVRVPRGYQVISVGRLDSRDSAREAEFDTWHWVSDRPMATYLNFVSIGHYEIREGRADGRPYVYAVSEQLSTEDRARAFAALERSAGIIRALEGMFGPYPFGEIGGIVPAHRLWFGGLETQTRPVYDRRSILDGDADSLIAHELAHMWFGDNVTLAQWNDIFTNEGYASWAQWGYEERIGGRSANSRLNSAYARLRDRADFWRITMIDPGADHLFDTVYVRGPMALQALRNVVGDEAFFALAREWGQQPGTRSLEEWMIRAQAKTSVDLAPFFRAWMMSPTVPARTAANGFR